MIRLWCDLWLSGGWKAKKKKKEVELLAQGLVSKSHEKEAVKDIVCGTVTAFLLMSDPGLHVQNW